MAFACDPVTTEEFSELEIDKLAKWLQAEEGRLARIPLAGLVENGARFFDDEYFGASDSPFRFNIKGIRSFCSVVGVRYETLELIERPSLATDVLNDLILQSQIKERMAGLDFVIDEGVNTIIGIVSDSYVSYSNKRFLQDVLSLLGGSGGSRSNDRFHFVSGFSINTQTILRFTLEIEGGEIEGRGGRGKDISRIGIQLKNSMVGDSAVNFDYFIYRLLCANGLIAPVGGTVNRVFHSGSRETFLARLKKCFSEVERTIGRAGELIQKLMEVPFIPASLAKSGLSDRIFDIIPGSRSTILDLKGIKKIGSKKLTEQEKIEREAEIISGIPDCFGGETSDLVFKSPYRDKASMFDFINIFTEHARSQPLETRVEIEERSGALADWIAKNKKKLA